MKSVKEDSILRVAAFRWLWAGQSISVLGSQISGLALPVLAVTLLGMPPSYLSVYQPAPGLTDG
jgi:hypothetical protein